MVFGNKQINRNIIYLHFYEVFCEKYFVIIYNLYINGIYDKHIISQKVFIMIYLITQMFYNFTFKILNKKQLFF